MWLSKDRMYHIMSQDGLNEEQISARWSEYVKMSWKIPPVKAKIELRDGEGIIVVEFGSTVGLNLITLYPFVRGIEQLPSDPYSDDGVVGDDEEEEEDPWPTMGLPYEGTR